MLVNPSIEGESAAIDELMKGVVEELTAAIVRSTHPLAVVLFGSRARGDHRLTSDIDLLIVVPDGVARRDVYRSLAAHRVMGATGVPVDLVIATPSGLTSAWGNEWSVLHWTQEQGVALYESKDYHFHAPSLMEAQ